jgi:hypothetical protein
MIKDRSQAILGSRWFLPLFCLALGVVILAVSWLGGQLSTSLYGLAGGHSGQPYAWLGAIWGLAYVATVAFFRWRG